jgi:hypothetical protein
MHTVLNRNFPFNPEKVDYDFNITYIYCILIYILHFYSVSASTTAIFVKAGYQLLQGAYKHSCYRRSVLLPVVCLSQGDVVRRVGR